MEDFADHETQSITRMELEEKKQSYLWSCLCGNTDSRLIKYLGQMGTLFLIMVFCIIQLSSTRLAPEEKNTYIGMLTMCLGIIVPNPKIQGEGNN